MPQIIKNLYKKTQLGLDRPYNGLLRFLKIADKKLGGHLSFFFKHFGKSRFMVSMSKKAQYLGLENLFESGPKAFFYFFIFYLIRDTILYILIPVYIAKFSGQ